MYDMIENILMLQIYFCFLYKNHELNDLQMVNLNPWFYLLDLKLQYIKQNLLDFLNMVEHLHKRIIGQEEAILAVSRAVKTARVGLRDPKRPIGSFLFLGPSGVGERELAEKW